MNKRNNKTNKTVSTLNYFTAVCFYIISIFNFLNKNNGIGMLYLCLGSTFMCLGTVWFNKDKNQKK